MTDNIIKNSFDKLLFSYPNNTISSEDNNYKQEEKTDKVKNIKESKIISDDQLSFFKDIFCNEDCSKKFKDYINNNSNISNLCSENKNELLKILLANAYKCGYAKGISNSKTSN
jgi:hypothetical protein